MSVDNSERRTLILTFLLALALVAFAVCMWFPQYRKQQALRARIDAANKQIKAEGAKVTGLTALAKEAAQLRVEAEKAQSRIPAEDGVGDLLRQLSERMDAHNLAAPERSNQPIVAGADFCVIPLALQFHGSYASTWKFLREVESMPRKVRVSNIQLNRPPGKLDEPLKARIDLCAFYVPRKESNQ